MAVHIIPDLVGLQLGSLTVYPSKSGDASIQYQPDIAGETTVDVDDIIIVEGDTRTLYKCVVSSGDFDHNGESSGASCIGIEDIINTVPWEAVNENYNVKDLPCVVEEFTDYTIQDFFNAEHVDLVATWFPNVNILGTVGDLLLPPIETEGKGFFDVLKEILAPYPHLRWAIEYSSAPSLYPLGDLVIYDAAEGRDSHVIQVGLNTAQLNVRKDIRECAEFVQLYGYGDFEERLEVAVPAWPKECLRERSTDIQRPLTPGDNIQIRNDDDQFFLDLHLYADDAQWYDAADQGTVPAGGVFGGRAQMRLWPGADVAYNVETGEVRFLFAEDTEGNDDSKWWWVNDEDGTVYPPDYFEVRPGKPVAPQFIPGIIRRPIGYRNSHLDEEVRYHCAYTTFTPEAFRCYAVKDPIADFRIRKTVFDTLDQGERDTFRQEADSLEAFRPRNAIVLYEDFQQTYEPVDYSAFNEVLFPGGTAADQEPFWVGEDGNIVVQAVTPIGGGANVPTFQIPSLQPEYEADTASLSFSILTGFWSEIESDVTYEEGLTKLRMSRRQLAAYPQWNDKPVKLYENNNTLVGSGVVAASLGIDNHIRIYTWPVMVHYTAWRDVIEERVTTKGLGKYVKNYMQSAFLYSDAIELDRSVVEPEPEVVFDNISQQDGPFILAADMLEEYYGQIDWTGSVEVTVTKGNDGWIVPYKVGDVVTFVGNVSDDIADFRGLINAVNLSRLEDGKVTLSFGKRVPSRSPFAPAQQVGLSTDLSGLDIDDPRAPAVERV